MISNIKNDKIKKFIKLRDLKKNRIYENSFTVEGVRLICEAVSSSVLTSSLFLTKECIEKNKDSIYDLTKFGNYNIISKEVAAKMSLVKTPQGAFAIAKKPKDFLKEEIVPEDLVLALYEIKDPGNLGSLIRSALSFGFLKIILYNCCDVFNQKVIRSSMGNIFKVSFLKCENFEDMLTFLKRRKIKTFATSVKETAISSKKLQNENGVLVLGGEANGLPKSLQEKCDFVVTIKMSKMSESLNVASAGSILMYEMKNY